MAKDREFNFRFMGSWNTGFTLIEVMVAAGVGAIVLMAMMSWTDNLLNQQKAMSQKMVSLEIFNSLQLLMTAPKQCTENLNLAGMTFPTSLSPNSASLTGTGLKVYNSTPAPIATPIPMGIPFPNGYGLQVSSIQLQNIAFISAGYYSADVVVNFSKTVTPLTPVSYHLFLNTTTSGPNQAVQSCGTTSCASNYTAVAGPNGEDAVCVEDSENPPATFASASTACAVPGYHLCTEEEWTEACNWDSGGSGNDNGPKLHMGSPQEWVGLVHLWDNGSARWAATLMGNVGGSAPNSGTCIGYDQFTGLVTGSTFPYRCCYRP